MIGWNQGIIQIKLPSSFANLCRVEMQIFIAWMACVLIDHPSRSEPVCTVQVSCTQELLVKISVLYYRHHICYIFSWPTQSSITVIISVLYVHFCVILSWLPLFCIIVTTYMVYFRDHPLSWPPLCCIKSM